MEWKDSIFVLDCSYCWWLLQMNLMQLQQKFQTFLANQRRIAAAQSSMESMGGGPGAAVGSSGAANNVNTYQPSPCLNSQQQLHNLIPNQTSHPWPTHSINGSSESSSSFRFCFVTFKKFRIASYRNNNVEIYFLDSVFKLPMLGLSKVKWS